MDLGGSVMVLALESSFWLRVLQSGIMVGFKSTVWRFGVSPKVAQLESWDWLKKELTLPGRAPHERLQLLSPK